MPDFTNIDAMQFFDCRPRELALYQDFECKVLAACPDTHIRVQKTQITLENRHGFAFVSLPRRKVQQPTIVVASACPIGWIRRASGSRPSRTPTAGRTIC